MDEELKCPLCKSLFQNPIILPCYHSFCFNCINTIILNSPRNIISATTPTATSPLPLPPPSLLNSTNSSTLLSNSNNQHSHINHSSNNNNNNNNNDEINLSTQTEQVCNNSVISSSSHSSSNISSSCASSEISEPDKLSLLSETDSGVICSLASRPSSYIGITNIHSLLFPTLLQCTSPTSIQLSCPVCSKIIFIDQQYGAACLPKNKLISNILDKYTGVNSNQAINCQLCEQQQPAKSQCVCEQCEIFYCEKCREQFHPIRGPLAKHRLHQVYDENGKINTRALRFTRNVQANASIATTASIVSTIHSPLNTGIDISSLKCNEHTDENINIYCFTCKQTLCANCLQMKDIHATHETQTFASMCKSQKTELSQYLQSLSERAKTATEFIQRLKGFNEKINETTSLAERDISLQCDQLLVAIENRKHQLLDYLQKEKEHKHRQLKEQVSMLTNKLQQTTGLIQYSIEALKETESTAFLQVASSLINRVNNREISWTKDLTSPNWVTPEFELNLDLQTVITAIDQLNFTQMKPPGPPILIIEECTVENNSITIAWKPQVCNFIEGYILELDDGNNGPFREVYCGKETICTVDGLHFDSHYRCRVKAFNSTGEGSYSETISLQTPDVAWFTLNPLSALPGLLLTNEKQTITSDTFEQRVILGNVGFSKGLHYWEITIDRYDGNADPAFGVARLDVAKDKMLGKDNKGWSMYIDNKRSWFLHADHHDHRCDGGIVNGSVIGILLDLDRHELSFFVNDEKQGPTAFKDLCGMFYPAISLNRNVQVSIQTGLEPPSVTATDSI